MSKCICYFLTDPYCQFDAHQSRHVSSDDTADLVSCEKVEVDPQRIEALAIRHEAHHHRNVAAPDEAVDSDLLRDLLEGGPDLRHRIVPDTAEENREQQLDVEVGMIQDGVLPLAQTSSGRLMPSLSMNDRQANPCVSAPTVTSGYRSIHR